MIIDTTKLDTGTALRITRYMKDLNQEQLSELLDIPISTIRKVEAGIRDMPDVHMDKVWAFIEE